MNEEEKYLFDLRGYLVVKNALTEKQVRRLSKIVDDKIERSKEENFTPDKKRNPGGSDRTRFDNNDDMAWSSPALLDWVVHSLTLSIFLLSLHTWRPYLE